jgi:hypothetical protein
LIPESSEFAQCSPTAPPWRFAWQLRGGLPLFLDTLKIALMSISEIIEELPKLSHSQRRELCQRIIDLEQEKADIEICDQTAAAAFSGLDQLEAGDRGHGEAGSR